MYLSVCVAYINRAMCLVVGAVVIALGYLSELINPRAELEYLSGMNVSCAQF